MHLIAAPIAALICILCAHQIISIIVISSQWLVICTSRLAQTLLAFYDTCPGRLASGRPAVYFKTSCLFINRTIY